MSRPKPLKTALETPCDRNQLAQIRLVATDMDGTLTDQGRFSTKLLQCLEQFQQQQFPVIVVTGRSAGWVSALAHYLPIAGAIAENGGVFFPATGAQPVLLSAQRVERSALAQMFARLQQRYPSLSESTDNPYRLTDWTFDVSGLSMSDLAWMNDACAEQGWSFTYSTVQCHIKPQGQEKATGLLQVLRQHFSSYFADLASDLAPDLALETETLQQQVLTVGDSPNDESLFNPQYFPYSVGVANVQHYLSQMKSTPKWITTSEAIEGFSELTKVLLCTDP
jgi:hydroxymethylpyrimidine pyrophosphatase-like HAD family hydrolase